jgi:sterol desaturase/sphingolipid hydroxylase (fatty acid hydroxylase superfamily)
MLGWIFVAFAAFSALESVRPGWRLPQVRSWSIRALATGGAQCAVVVIAGMTWAHWFQRASIFDLGDAVPTWVAGAGAYFAATFVFYWWHRWRHESDWLWRHFHQIHHSARRLETITSFYKHPLEMIVNSIISATLVYGVLGLPIEAGAVFTLCAAATEFFYHANWRTPRWIGYVIQRPEMHRIHHQHEYHRSNYGDIVWWDMLFGTYENPAQWKGRCGFRSADEERLVAMLAFHDVHGDRREAHRGPDHS